MTAVLLVALCVAVMVELKASLLYRRYAGLVPTVKFLTVCPAGTVMLGTEVANSVSELVSVTTEPPAGAGELSATVQEEEWPVPPPMVAGIHVNDVTDA